jgi:hypothetical protein
MGIGPSGTIESPGIPTWQGRTYSLDAIIPVNGSVLWTASVFIPSQWLTNSTTGPPPSNAIRKFELTLNLGRHNASDLSSAFTTFTAKLGFDNQFIPCCMTSEKVNGTCPAPCSFTGNNNPYIALTPSTSLNEDPEWRPKQFINRKGATGTTIRLSPGNANFHQIEWVDAMRGDEWNNVAISARKKAVIKVNNDCSEVLEIQW